jgi:hypothetical protein
MLISDNAPGNPQAVSFVGNDSGGGGGTATVTLNSSMNPVPAGQPVTFTAKVTPQTQGTPTGAVLFLDGVNTIGSVPLNLGSNGMASFTTSSLAPGSHSITAAYAGNFAFQGATSPAINEVVSGGGLATSMTAVQSSLNPSTVGQSVTFTAAVTSASPGTPTGTVAFFDGVTQIGSGGLNAQAQATFAITTLTQGSHSITTQYSGDANFAGSTSAPLSQVVNANSKPATTTALSSSVNPSTLGQSTTFTAKVTSTSPGTPTGTVMFFDGAAQIGMGSLNAQAIAMFPTTALALGSHSITAQYGGDANFAASTSTPLTQVVNPVAKSSTSTMLASSPNPSTVNQSVTFTATVTSQAQGTPTGTVVFFDAANQIGMGNLNAQGVATLATTALTQGSHSITAQYGGDTNFSTSASLPLTQVVNAAAQDFSVSASPAAVTVSTGQSRMVTFSVTPLNGSTQTVALACANVPATLTCSFGAPASVTLDGQHIATATATIQKAAGVAAAPADASPMRLWYWIFPLVAFCLFVWARVLAWRFGSLGKRSRLAAGAALLLLVLTAVGLAACPGGHHSTSVSINLTGTSGATAHSAAVAVTID